MLIFLFGPTGVGKSYIGNVLTRVFGYYFWDADTALTEAMYDLIKKKKMFTQKMRDDFTQLIILKIQSLSSKYSNIVVSQALYKERNRKQIKDIYNQVKFIYIISDGSIVADRIVSRNNLVDSEYAKIMQSKFDPPDIEHMIIINNGDEDELITQLKSILKQCQEESNL